MFTIVAADLVEGLPPEPRSRQVRPETLWEVCVLADLNFVALTGFSTREPALRQKSSGQVKAEFSFEVDRPFMRANGKPVSDLFLVDAWQELGEWVMENVSAGTRLLVIGTLNKESYTSHGSREHMTIVKAKYIRLADGSSALDNGGQFDGLKDDCWSEDLLLSAVALIEESIRNGEGFACPSGDSAPAETEAATVAGES